MNEDPNYLFETGYIKDTIFAVSIGLDPSYKNNLPLNQASINGYSDLVKFLLKCPKVNPRANNERAIKTSFEYGHKGVLKNLLYKVPSVIQNNNDDQLNGYNIMDEV